MFMRANATYTKELKRILRFRERHNLQVERKAKHLQGQGTKTQEQQTDAQVENRTSAQVNQQLARKGDNEHLHS
ncbi:hypothetical protein P3342_007527 [Pyrenophora teres f. teres]|nr:hypothetical protein P3342_007527 [Pyrenophora teres f. teres]